METSFWISVYLGIGSLAFSTYIRHLFKERVFSKGFLSLSAITVGFLVFCLCLLSWPLIPVVFLAIFFEDNKDPLIIWRKPKYKKNTKLFSIKYNKVVIVEEIDHDNKLNYEYLLKPINGHPSYYEEEWIIKKNYKIIPKGELTGAIYD